MKIGIFDSGLGGLTVLKRLIMNYQNYEYIYYGDTIHIPYGNKKKEIVIKYAQKIIDFLEKENVDIIIIACGTVSSNIEYLHSKKIIIDILSPLKGKLDNYQNISILATSLSIKINAFKKYIKTNINLIACPKLVPMIESNDYAELDKVLHQYLEKAKDSELLLLGCTHYLIIRNQIEKCYKGKIVSLDEFVVDKLKDLEGKKYNLKLYFSKIDDKLIMNVKKILELSNVEIERRIL